MRHMMLKNKNKLYRSIFLHFIEPSIDIDNFEFYDANKIKKLKNNSLEAIYIGDLLDYVNPNNSVELIATICSKLKSGGLLHIQSNDSRSLASALIYNNINNKIFKNMIFGSEKKTIYTLGELKQVINDVVELKVTKCKFLNAIQYYIECVKL